MTKHELELFDFSLKRVWGRVSYIFKRYSKANNKHLKSYDQKQGKHIRYLDTNNLYGYAISKFIARCGFRWVDPKNFDSNKYNRRKAYYVLRHK